MRSIDIAGLLGVMVAALLVVAFHRSVARALQRVVGPTQPRAARGVSEAALTLAVLAMGAATVALSSLAALGVVEPRPGPYPGSPITEAVAVAGLVALVAILAQKLRAARSESSAPRAAKQGERSAHLAGAESTAVVMSWLLPGAGHVYLGCFSRGLAALALFAPVAVATWTELVPVPLGILAAGPLWIAAQVDLWRRLSRHSEVSADRGD